MQRNSAVRCLFLSSTVAAVGCDNDLTPHGASLAPEDMFSPVNYDV